MKYWGLGLALAGVAFANFQAPQKTNEYVLFLSGDAQGYLSPCGCSAPMVGGTKRRATAISRLGVKGRTLLLENGGLVKHARRQDEIKLETFAQLHASTLGGGMNLSPHEASLGPGAILSMSRLSGNRLLTASIKGADQINIPESRTEGPFLISGVTARPDSLAGLLGAKPVPLAEAVSGLVLKATNAKKSLVLILDGSRDDAVKLAQAFPKIALIQYRTAGRPSDKQERIGKVLIASPGDGGRYIVRLVWKGDRFTSYVPVELDPGFKDDAKASTIYKTYLRRVSGEGLLEELPRTKTDKFVGTEACGKCHAEDHDVWKKSKHAVAHKTLETEGHERDPDCVGCHVVGLSSTEGFRSRKETPDLADVGCESCHGPGSAHSADPMGIKMGKVGETSCQPCHTVENSPRFNFTQYWAKVKH